MLFAVLGAFFFSLSSQVMAATSSVPWVRTLSPSGITSESAILYGQVDAKGPATYFRFEYAPRGGSQVATQLYSAGAGNYRRNVRIIIRDLLPDTLYYYRIVAGNRLGAVPGGLVSFKTLPAAELPERPVPEAPIVSGGSSLPRRPSSLLPWLDERGKAPDVKESDSDTPTESNPGGAQAGSSNFRENVSSFLNKAWGQLLHFWWLTILVLIGLGLIIWRLFFSPDQREEEGNVEEIILRAREEFDRERRKNRELL